MDEARLIVLREQYEGALSDEEIEKAQTYVRYALYDTATGEIIQTGKTDLLAYENLPLYREGMEKTIIPDDEKWMLRGEFIDESAGKRMFKIGDKGLTAKTAHVEKITEMRMPRDGLKKKPIEAEGIGGTEIIGIEIVQEPLRIEEQKNDNQNPKRIKE